MAADNLDALNAETPEEETPEGSFQANTTHRGPAPTAIKDKGLPGAPSPTAIKEHGL